jgi:hypothetical protein
MRIEVPPHNGHSGTNAPLTADANRVVPSSMSTPCSICGKQGYNGKSISKDQYVQSVGAGPERKRQELKAK